MLSAYISNIAIITIKNVDYCCIIHGAINLLKNSVPEALGHIYITYQKNQYYRNQVHYRYENSIKAKTLEARNIFIDKKRCKDLVIYFTRYHHDKSFAMWNQHNGELIGKIEEYELKIILDGWWLYTR